MAGPRNIPSVQVLSQHPSLADFSAPRRVAAARVAIAEGRVSITDPFDFVFRTKEILDAEAADSLCEVINCTGVILHTGAGRARLAPSAAAHLQRVAEGHAAVELDLSSGERGNRQSHVSGLLCEQTGAEAALVVNNCAAAVWLMLAALTQGREVLLSRGQMVEIGGSFRMPDIIRQSGATLVEVGCTNKTHLRDYELAVTENTAAVLRCHPSNFRQTGFVSQPSAAELRSFSDSRGLLFLDDHGSGGLVDLARFGLTKTVTLSEAVGHAHLVVASGDKLLGGPQAGLCLGRADLIAQMARHPLARALRVDKLTLAALEATLRLYRDGRELEIPTLAAMAVDLATVKRRAQRLARAVPGSLVSEGTTEVGGGSAPGEGLPTWRVGLAGSASAWAQKLRSHRPAVLGRIENDRFWLDPRTMTDVELGILRAILAAMGPQTS